MGGAIQTIRVEQVAFKEVAGRIACLPSLTESNFCGNFADDLVDVVHAEAGSLLVRAGDKPPVYWFVLEGRLRADRTEQDGSVVVVGYANRGEGSGETPLMTGKDSAQFHIVAEKDSVLVRFTGEQFWHLMGCCPEIRALAVRDMTSRVQSYQMEALHREKLVTLGTLSAGLMHELKNPGAAATRAASLLRENLTRLQEIALRMSEAPKTPQQLACMKSLLLHAAEGCRLQTMSSTEQSDAEEALSEWLAEAHVANAYTIGPALVEMGFNAEELACARAEFDSAAFSDALNWLGALVSSFAQVCAIDESIGRVMELVLAVKKFAWDDKSGARSIDVHDSLQSTLTILGHKLRIKQIRVEKRFDASPSTIETRGPALAQVWTNLIDNAADASPLDGQVEIATWTEPEWLAVSITDHGPGIPADVMPHIFEAFFTTKPQGSGTGLGLEIAHRIVTQKFGGKIDVESKPGETRFTVRLPRNATA